MNLKTKKIIAREFILLLISFVFTGAFYLFCFYPYKNFQVNKYNKLELEINSKRHIVDSLRGIVLVKKKAQRNFTNYFNFNGFKQTSTIKFWTVLYRLAKSDSISYYWENNFTKDFKFHLSHLGYYHPKQLQNFILSNIINKTDDEISILADKKNSEVNALREKRSEANNRIYSDKQICEQAVSCLYILLAVLFGLRYLFYAIRWSVNVLKEH